jgi:predicted RNA polymerase sigma factor
MTGNPMATLNRAIALAMVQGPVVGWLRSPASTRDWPASTGLDAVRAHPA